MSSSSFPDLNVWLALAIIEHSHSHEAREWWRSATGPILFTRLTQIGFLRLVTTAAAMDGKPISMAQAWKVYDSFFKDDRVAFLPEPVEVELQFRKESARKTASPKVWADAWLLAVASSAGGQLVTFDRALARRGAHCLLTE